jgi:transcriptional regulator
VYLPKHFEETDHRELHRIIGDFPLGALVINGPDGLDADHLPFELEPKSGERGLLRAHVARANALWQRVRDGDPVLVVFRAGDAYVSPNWYPSKHEFHRQVPTWNYRVVHVHGRIAIRDDERYVRGVVARLTRVHEAGSGAERPWRMTDSSTEFIDAMLAAIVGIEIAIDRIVGKSKLGQNREARDREAAADALAQRGHAALAAAMRAAGPPAKP